MSDRNKHRVEQQKESGQASAPAGAYLSFSQSSIGSQVRLPFATAFRISVQGIRIRFGRSLVTLSGVVLGIAFLMSNITGQIIKNAVSTQDEVRQQADLMLNLIGREIGREMQGKHLSIAVFGALSPAETEMVRKIVAAKPSSLRGLGLPMAGVTLATDAKGLSEGACLLLVLGNAINAPVSLEDLTQGMTQKVILDAEKNRTFIGADPSVRREFFFGSWLEQQKLRLEKEARQARARTLWIVVISLLVTVIGVSNALMMSVTERFREIGTMKCLGALSKFIRTLFLIESSMIGLAGSIFGVVVGAILPIVAYGMTQSFQEVLGSMPYGMLVLAGLASIVVGTILAILAAIYPAAIASRMLPASALRSTV